MRSVLETVDGNDDGVVIYYGRLKHCNDDIDEYPCDDVRNGGESGEG